MTYTRKCHIYENCKCNCPTSTCYRQRAEDEAKLKMEQERLEEEGRLNRLIEFQEWLVKLGLAQGEWSYEEAAKRFLTKK